MNFFLSKSTLIFSKVENNYNFLCSCLPILAGNSKSRTKFSRYSTIIFEKNINFYFYLCIFASIYKIE
ncbi:MAG: hypothetical protein EAZ85_15135 [Bacteroidetes bacterium]|nr:MAG: hypothetical protein EAZ85_15135 [Bacteroidota bacterium]